MEYTTLLLTVGGVIVVAVIWVVVAQFVFKLTLKILSIGCLGILVLGAICATTAYFGSGR